MAQEKLTQEESTILENLCLKLEIAQTKREMFIRELYARHSMDPNKVSIALDSGLFVDRESIK